MFYYFLRLSSQEATLKLLQDFKPKTRLEIMLIVIILFQAYLTERKSFVIREESMDSTMSLHI